RFSRDWSSDVCSSDLKDHCLYKNLWDTLIWHFEGFSKQLRKCLGLTIRYLSSAPIMPQYPIIPNTKPFPATSPSLFCFITRAGRSEERRVGKERSSRW